ncbi:hypothetical protein T11_16437, partial [Trichinella zimbabwensis]
MSTDSGGFAPSPQVENCQQHEQQNQQVPKAPPRRRHAWKKFLLSLGRLTSAIDTGAFVSTCPRIRMSTTCATVERHHRRAGSAPTSVNRYAASVQHQWNQVATWAGRRRRLQQPQQQQHFKFQPEANTVAADSEPATMGLLRLQDGEARRATWLWQSNGDLSVVNLPQTMQTDHLDKPYYSMNNLTQPDSVASIALLKMEPTPRGWVKLKNANRVASVEPMYSSAEQQHAEVQSARGPLERQRPLMRGRRPWRPPALYTGSAWDVRSTTTAGEQQQLVTKKSTMMTAAQSSDGVKTSGKKSAFVRGLCDLASVERLRQWKAKLPLVNRGRQQKNCHTIINNEQTNLPTLWSSNMEIPSELNQQHRCFSSSCSSFVTVAQSWICLFVCLYFVVEIISSRRKAEKARKEMSLLHDVRHYLSLRNCTKRPARRFQHHSTGRHSAASMGEEGNYDVPVTPNRLEAMTTEKEEACLRSARLVNAYAYYNNNNSQWQEAKRQAAHTRQASAAPGQAAESAATSSSSNSSVGDPSLLQQSRCYFVPSYAPEPRFSAYDNAETLMATRKMHCAASIVERRPHLQQHHQTTYQPNSQKSKLHKQDSERLPPPSRLVAFGGIPNSTTACQGLYFIYIFWRRINRRK